MKQEFLFADMGALCEPKQNITNYDNREITKWCTYPYETDEVKGSMLVSFDNGRPKDVTLSPQVNGWYKIFVGLYMPSYRNSTINLKLSDDKAFAHMSPCLKGKFGEHFIEDVFWKCAQMDGQSIVVGKHLSNGYSEDACLAWIRLVEMTQEEVEVYLFEKYREDTKCIYATNDMHCMLCFYDMQSESAWRSVVQEYEDSDVEWLAVESLSYCDLEMPVNNLDNFMFARKIDRAFQKRCKYDYSEDMLKNIVSYGHEQGLKMCISLRVAHWDEEIPYDEIYFRNSFAMQHPEYRCIDRDGDVTEYLSFVYPQVQDYIIKELERMASTDCDAVQAIFTRGWPFILYEKPFLELFYERFGEDARKFPLDHEKVVSLKCEIMTDFMRRLHLRLGQRESKRNLELHAKVMFSMYDNKILGLDLETWAREGLIDRIISDERRIREILDGDVWDDEDSSKINIDKYSVYARKREESIIRYDYDKFFEPLQDSSGVLRGPKTQQERIAEFMELEKKYGVIVYIEIMPRTMSTEKIKEKALEIYNAGCNHIGLWDTYQRVCRKSEWTMWRRIGHRVELPRMSSELEGLYSKKRILKIGEKNVRNYKPMWGG